MQPVRDCLGTEPAAPRGSRQDDLDCGAVTLAKTCLAIRQVEAPETTKPVVEAEPLDLVESIIELVPPPP